MLLSILEDNISFGWFIKILQYRLSAYMLSILPSIVI